ncbi:hypothetical protein BpHYR1_026987 [Brachionus plicatilis]|uniref:Uncharacterized protein n=1 Tax=Brachionus plicatilis TaxID=10195 RepID=A0A3M7SPL6_BRAPC|nr:hypothetical protein BpHYR1_026987 [Brachionus plicatilis]
MHILQKFPSIIHFPTFHCYTQQTTYEQKNPLETRDFDRLLLVQSVQHLFDQTEQTVEQMMALICAQRFDAHFVQSGKHAAQMNRLLRQSATKSPHHSWPSHSLINSHEHSLSKQAFTHKLLNMFNASFLLSFTLRFDVLLLSWHKFRIVFINIKLDTLMTLGVFVELFQVAQIGHYLFVSASGQSSLEAGLNGATAAENVRMTKVVSERNARFYNVARVRHKDQL